VRLAALDLRRSQWLDLEDSGLDPRISGILVVFTLIHVFLTSA